MEFVRRAVGCVAASGCAFAGYKIYEQNKRPTIFSRQQVSAHDTAQDCWIVIDNGVYDVTQWLDKHPGLYAIVYYALRSLLLMHPVKPCSKFQYNSNNKKTENQTNPKKVNLPRYWPWLVKTRRRSSITSTAPKY